MTTYAAKSALQITFDWPAFDLQTGAWYDSAGTVFDPLLHEAVSGIPCVDDDGVFEALGSGSTQTGARVPRSGLSPSVAVVASDGTPQAVTVTEIGATGVYLASWDADTTETYHETWAWEEGDESNTLGREYDPAKTVAARMEEAVPGGDPVFVGPAPVAGQAVLWTYTYDHEGVLVDGVTFTAQLVEVDGDDVSNSTLPQTVKSGRNLSDGSTAPSGYLYFIVRDQGTRKLKIRREHGVEATITIDGTASDYRLPLTLGKGA